MLTHSKKYDIKNKLKKKLTLDSKRINKASDDSSKDNKKIDSEDKFNKSDHRLFHLFQNQFKYQNDGCKESEVPTHDQDQNELNCVTDTIFLNSGYKFNYENANSRTILRNDLNIKKGTADFGDCIELSNQSIE